MEDDSNTHMAAALPGPFASLGLVDKMRHPIEVVLTFSLINIRWSFLKNNLLHSRGISYYFSNHVGTTIWRLYFDLPSSMWAACAVPET